MEGFLLRLKLLSCTIAGCARAKAHRIRTAEGGGGGGGETEGKGRPGTIVGEMKRDIMAESGGGKKTRRRKSFSRHLTEGGKA